MVVRLEHVRLTLDLRQAVVHNLALNALKKRHENSTRHPLLP